MQANCLYWLGFWAEIIGRVRE